jgi:glycosyltransferase involved in cell wall biosynthesis
MKSVTHVITTIELGGAEKQLLILAKQQIQMGLNVSIIYLKGEPDLADQFKKMGVQNLISLEGFSFAQQFFKLKPLLGQEMNVHAHLPRAELLVALSANSDSRVIVSRHNAEQFFPGAPKFVSRLLSNFVVSRSFTVIAISAAVLDFLTKKGEVKADEKIRVIYYGSSTDSRSSVEYQWSQPKTLGTVARLTEQKDYGTLLRAFSLFLRDNPGYTLQVIGVGHLEVTLKNLAIELGISNHVQWLGKVPEPSQYIATWDLFILTSLYEGFGLVLLESMALEVPIVASGNSAINEVLGTDYVGLARTSDPEDFARRMHTLINVDNRLRAQQQMKKSFVRFQPELMAKNVCGLYA